MSHVFKVLVSIVTVTMLTLLCTSSKPKKKMEQVYYTIEGKKYVMRSVTKKVPDVVLASDDAVTMQAYLQPDQPIDPNEWRSIEIKTSSAIIPLLYTLSFVKGIGLGGNNPTVDIASPYYMFFKDNVPQGDHLKFAPKVFQNLELLTFTDYTKYQYALKYNQIVLSYDDFIKPTGFVSLIYVPTQANGLTNTIPDPATLVIPAGTYQVAVTFSYFELVNN